MPPRPSGITGPRGTPAQIFFGGSKNDFKGISSIFPALRNSVKLMIIGEPLPKFFWYILKMILKALNLAFSLPSKFCKTCDYRGTPAQIFSLDSKNDFKGISSLIGSQVSDTGP